MVNFRFFVLLYDFVLPLLPSELNLQIKVFVLFDPDDFLIITLLVQDLAKFVLRIGQTALKVLDFVVETA